MANWRIELSLDEDGRIDFGNDGFALEESKPVDLLLASVGACFARSCHIVQAARGEDPTWIELEIVGTKSADRTKRLAHVVIGYRFRGLASDHAERIGRDAKRICTVTNSLVSEISVERRP